MHSFTRSTLLLAVFGLGLGSTGCLLAGNYHTAKTLEKGQSSFGATFSAVTYEFTDQETGDVDRVSLPALIPELTFHVGLQDNLEIGGRVGLAQLAMEGDIKYRFLKSDNLHLAIAPAIGVQSLIVINGLILKLPIVATYEFSDNVSITGAAFATQTNYSTPDANADGDDFGTFSGSLVGTGGAISLEFGGTNFGVRPGVEYTTYVASFEGEQFEPFSTISLFVHLEFKFGGRNKQLDRIENKMDMMNGGQPTQPM